MKDVLVVDMMTPQPMLIAPDATLQEAAKRMRQADCGMLPVGVNGDITGVITDRDIMMRAIAEGKDPAREIVSTYMTSKVYGCNEEDNLLDAAEKMRAHKVSRLVVRDRSGHVIGVLSFGGILRKEASASDIVKAVLHSTRQSVI